MGQKAQYDQGPRGFVTSLCSELPYPDIMLKNHCPSLGLTDIIQLVGSRSSDFPWEGSIPKQDFRNGGGHFGLSPWHLVAEGRDVGWLTKALEGTMKTCPASRHLWGAPPDPW